MEFKHVVKLRHR